MTPEFLRATLAHLRAQDIDLVNLDEARRRLVERDFSRRFACFTLDDGYRDNRDVALPVFEAFEAPFTVYVTSEFAQGDGRLWWIALERAIAKADQIKLEIGGAPLQLDASTPAAKQIAFERLHDWIREFADRGRCPSRSRRAVCASRRRRRRALRRTVHALGRIEVVCGASAGHDRRPRRQPLQPRQAGRGERRARIELQPQPASRTHCSGRRCISPIPMATRPPPVRANFALAQNSGFKTAVTTRPGMLFPENADHLTALPRLSLNGNYQDTRLLPVLTSGVATAMWNGFRRVNAA